MVEEQYRFIITKKGNTVCYGYFHNDSPLELYCEPEESKSLIGNIYAARVDKVVRDIGGAFLEIGQGMKCYYPLPKNGQKPVLLSPVHKNRTASHKEDILYGGDIILVQITKDAVKTKLPMADSNISLTGKYFVLTLSDVRTGVSRKIREEKERERLAEIAGSFCTASEPFGIIIRTNAAGVPEDILRTELSQLKDEYTKLMRRACTAPGKTLLKKDAPYYITYPRDIPRDALTEIVTDQTDIYESLVDFYGNESRGFGKAKEVKESEGPDVARPQDEEILSKLRLYRDEYPLWKLYRMESHYRQAQSKTVWLPSGGSLVIEPTEAMVVIDVNTAGVTRKKQKEEDLFYQINREAALEISRQLRLRNLSGIIVIDFINMRYEKHQKKLVNYLKEVCERDRIRTHVMDITALNLVEMTRQKTRKPLHEQIHMCNVQVP